jgi:hypothetical protein
MLGDEMRIAAESRSQQGYDAPLRLFGRNSIRCREIRNELKGHSGLDFGL